MLKPAIIQRYVGIALQTESRLTRLWAAMQRHLHLVEKLSLAITPLLTDAASGMTVLSKRLATPAPEAPPLNTALLPARPNPFNPKTEISFTLRQPGKVSLAIYNLRGQRVRQLLDETCTTGTHKLEWAGTDDNDRVVPSGVYLARMQADGSNLSQRLLLVK